jgi:4-amino-4-deoxy-L-arabinose transferase-like glycosyltransferase
MPESASPQLLSRTVIVLIALVLALGFIGLRPLWDPDEGRYTNVALRMIESGDWTAPQRHHETGHWTKPPLTYWAIAGSVSLLGSSEFAARLPNALAYLLSTLLVYFLARRLAPGRQRLAALVYACMGLPALALEWISADFLLSVLELAAAAAFVEARFGPHTRTRICLLGMWVAFGLAFLVKGPPALLPLLAFVAFDLLAGRSGRGRLLAGAGLVAFAAIAASWFLVVGIEHPGLIASLLDREVVERVASESHARNPQWYGWMLVYLPTLLLGSLPWTFVLLGRLRHPVDVLRRWRSREARTHDAADLLLALWICLPLLVFCLARSRMPLYLLPLFPAIALAATRGLRRIPTASLLVAVPVLLLIKTSAALLPTDKDARSFAQEIREHAAGSRIGEVVFVEDMARYGVHFYLGVEVEKVSMEPQAKALIDPEYDQDLRSEIAESEPDVLWIARSAQLDQIRAIAHAADAEMVTLGMPFQGRVAFRIHHRPTAQHPATAG